MEQAKAPRFRDETRRFAHRLCDLCNGGEFFGIGHSAGRFSCSLVSNLLQQTGVCSMQTGVCAMQTGVCAMKSQVVKRSIVVAGHKTSVSLEDAFWKGLKEIAGGRHMTLSDLVATIDSERQYGNLSSAIRLFVLDFYRNQLSVVKEAPDGSSDMITT